MSNGEKIAQLSIFSFIKSEAYPFNPAQIGFPVDAYSNSLDGSTFQTAL